MEEIENTSATAHIALLSIMRADENASIPEKKANRTSNSELPEEDARFGPLYSLQREQRERNDEETEGKQGRKERWHTFKTP
jgi:hypothetical protein